MLTKTCAVRVKTPDEGETSTGDGTFEAIVSVFGNKDLYGDIVQKGAFAGTLERWAASGDPIPIYYSHRLDDPDYCIGEVLEAVETDEGLKIKGKLDIDQQKAASVYRLLKGRRVKQFSFSYGVIDGEMDDAENAYMLKELELYEVGPTPIGANPETELLAVKAAANVARDMESRVKSGRVLSAKNESELRTAHESIGRVLEALQSAGDASAFGPVKSEEPESAKLEEPSQKASVDTVLTLIHLQERMLA